MERWRSVHYLDHFSSQFTSGDNPHGSTQPIPSPNGSPTFEDWLATDLGSLTRRNLRYRASERYWWGAVNDGDDIEQRGLIYLWRKWEADPTWFEQHSSRYLGKAAFRRGQVDRFTLRLLRGNQVNEGLALLESEDGEEVEGGSLDPTHIKDTHLNLRDRQTVDSERRIDVAQAIQATIQELEAAEAARPSNGHTVPVRRIVLTICHAFMYYSGQSISNGSHPRRTSSDGGMEAFWRQHISEKQWIRWKPRVLGTLKKYLVDYEHPAEPCPPKRIRQMPIPSSPETATDTKPYQIYKTRAGAKIRLYPKGQASQQGIIYVHGLASQIRANTYPAKAK